MSVFLARSGTAAALVFLSAQGALADVTAQEVWDDWKAYMASTGYTVDATETQTGSTLSVTGITMTMPMGAQDGSFRVAMPQVKFVENGDGSVNIELPTDMPVSISATGPEEDFASTVIYGHDGSPMVVTGDAAEMAYAYKTPEITLTLQDLKADGEQITPEAAQFSMALEDWDSLTTMRAGESRRYDQQLSVAQVSYDFAFADAENGAKGAVKGTAEGLAFAGDSNIPSRTDSPDFAALLQDGAAFGGRFTFAGSTSTLSGNDGKDAFAMESRSGSGVAAVSLSAGGLSYDVSQQDTDITVSGSSIPFPLSLSMAEAGIRLMLPMSASEEEQDFAFGLTLRDFVLPEMLWGMVDPTGVLPHDPATLVLDLAGKSTLLVDLYDEDAMQQVEQGAQAPGELNAVTVKELRLTAAGAELTGTGDFTFNNDDLESYDGMPAPSGEANLMLTGANALIDKLIQLGVLSDGDAMGARMMMGMLAVPGETEDSLKSKIEITEDGKILANGQRLK